MIFIAQINFVIALKDADSMLNDGIENKLGFRCGDWVVTFRESATTILFTFWLYNMYIVICSIGNMMKTDEIIYLFLHSVFQIPFFYFLCVCFCRIFFSPLGYVFGVKIFFLCSLLTLTVELLLYLCYVVKYPFVICFLVPRHRHFSLLLYICV